MNKSFGKVASVGSHWQRPRPTSVSLQLQRPVLRLNNLTLISTDVAFFPLSNSRRLRHRIHLWCRNPALPSEVTLLSAQHAPTDTEAGVGTIHVLRRRDGCVR